MVIITFEILNKYHIIYDTVVNFKQSIICITYQKNNTFECNVIIYLKLVDIWM